MWDTIKCNNICITGDKTGREKRRGEERKGKEKKKNYQVIMIATF